MPSPFRPAPRIGLALFKEDPRGLAAIIALQRGAMKAKILVVGGGVMGTCIAQYAAKKCDPLGEPVILIEKGQLGDGSSSRAGGIIYQNYSDRVLAGMARDAIKIYAGFEGIAGRSVGFRRTGVLSLVGPDNNERRTQLEADIAMQNSIGIATRFIGDDEIRQLVPGIEIAGGTVAAWEPESGFVDPSRTIRAFATLARAYGAVTRIGVSEPRVLIKNGRAVGVETDQGTFTAPKIVLATGSWMPSMLRELDVDLPLRVLKTDQVYLSMPTPGGEDGDEDFGESQFDSTDPFIADLEARFGPDPAERRASAHPIIFDHDEGFSVRCDPVRDRTRIGRLGVEGLEETNPEDPPGKIDPKLIMWAREAVSKRLPVYTEQTQVGLQSTQVTVTPDERPIVGPIEAIPGLYMVTGFSGNDFQLAPTIGEGMAQMLHEQPVSAFDTEFFSAGRF